MSPTIWLITEDETDFKAIRRILIKNYPTVIVRRVPLTGGSGGVARLAQQLSGLIRGIKNQDAWYDGDCIVVVHDLDAQAPNRNPEQYAAIARICKTAGVIHLIPDDKIEAWLLADNGLCAFLEIPAKNWDSKADVKDELESLLRKKKMVYQARDRDRLIDKLDGTGHKKSPSMRQSLKKLVDAGCISA